MARFYVEMPLEGVVRLMVEIPDDDCIDEDGPVRSIVLEEAAAMVDRLLDLRVDHVDVEGYEVNAVWQGLWSGAIVERIDVDDVPEVL